MPPLPQGRPVMLQAGDSDAGREFAAAHADGIFTRHGKLEEGSGSTPTSRAGWRGTAARPTSS